MYSQLTPSHFLPLNFFFATKSHEHALGETWTHEIYLEKHADHLPSHRGRRLIGTQWNEKYETATHLRFILIGERFFSQNFLSLEIIGNMYQYTEAFCHYSWNYPEEAEISSSLTSQYLGKRNRKKWKIEKLRETNVEKLGKKLPDKNDFFNIIIECLRFFFFFLLLLLLQKFSRRNLLR